ncbi:MAG TPA: glycosyltransferase family 4 protein [Solirubrobacteraceae bacterium]|nr:glycosyltransferase family 4 protein [Solirubrobacteraceae bacterium]
MTRVALCHPTYWPEVRRGAERLVHDLAHALAARGHAPRIVTGHAGAPARARDGGVEVVRLWRPPDGRLRRRLLEDHLPLAPLTYLELRRGRDEVVQALQAPDAAAAARWTRATGRPSVYAHMGIPHRAWLTSRRARLELVQQAVAGCSAVSALSEHARDAFWTWLGVEARVIPPPVDVEAFRPGGERDPDPVVVCAADAREPRKRVGLLVEAFARVRREHPRARLLLDARTAGRLADPAAGVEAVAMDDLPALYRRAWVSALPSWGEAFGLVLAEALACGTPVVGSAREGIPEVLGGDDRVGRLFSGEEPAALAQALLEAIELARDPATAAACRARAETFSAARCAERHEALYAELLAG